MHGTMEGPTSDSYAPETYESEAPGHRDPESLVCPECGEISYPEAGRCPDCGVARPESSSKEFGDQIIGLGPHLMA